jgi:hypothetical protein
MTGASSLSPPGRALSPGREDPRNGDMLQRVRQQRKVARSLHGLSDGALSLGAGAGLASRLDLSTVAYELAEPAHVLVVQLVFVTSASALVANAAHLAAATKAPELRTFLLRWPRG